MKVASWPARKNAARNPFQKLLFDAIEQHERQSVLEFHPAQLFARKAPDVLHVHWPDGFLAADTGGKFWIRLALLRGMLELAHARGTALVWTAHNLKRPGQRNGESLNRYFWPWFLERLDGVIFMTATSAHQAELCCRELAARPRAVIPHGHYKPVLKRDTAPTGCERAPQALFFGGLSIYKGVSRLLEAFLELPPGVARLAIRGEMSDREPDTRFLTTLQEVPPERASEIHYEPRFLEQDELVLAIGHADLVVLPYSDVLNSGAALFALSVGRPILASDTPLFRELQSHVGQDWVYLIEGDLTGSGLLNALERARLLRTSGREPDLSVFDWETIAHDTVRFYRRVRKSGRVSWRARERLALLLKELRGAK